MWRGRVHGMWFAGAVAIAVIGVFALSSSLVGSCPSGLEGKAASCPSGSHDAGSWIIAAVTLAGVAYCLYRASRRAPKPPDER